MLRLFPIVSPALMRVILDAASRLPLNQLRNNNETRGIGRKWRLDKLVKFNSNS
jgi:hypothetical protein